MEVKKSKKKKKNALPVKTTYDVKLSDSVCFATGGGQPNDEGLLSGVKIVNVFRDTTGEVIHQLEGPVPVGEELHMEVDWVRRLDHMQQHTGKTQLIIYNP